MKKAIISIPNFKNKNIYKKKGKKKKDAASLFVSCKEGTHA